MYHNNTPQTPEQIFWAKHRSLVQSAVKGDRQAARLSLAIERYMQWYWESQQQDMQSRMILVDQLVNV